MKQKTDIHRSIIAATLKTASKKIAQPSPKWLSSLSCPQNENTTTPDKTVQCTGQYTPFNACCQRVL